MNQLITTAENDQTTDRFCGNCGTEVVACDNFCRNCGNACHVVINAAIATRENRAVGHVDNATGTAISNSAAESLQYVLNNRWMVMGVVALIGPLGLPVLWFSPRFKPTTKFVITGVYVLLTAIIPVVVSYYVLESSFKPIADVFGS